MSAHCSAGQADQALAVIENLEEAGYSVNHVAFGQLMKGFAREHKYDSALEAFDRVVQTKQPSAYSYHLALVLAEAKQDAALQERVAALVRDANVDVDPLLTRALRKQLGLA